MPFNRINPFSCFESNTLFDQIVSKLKLSPIFLIWSIDSGKNESMYKTSIAKIMIYLNFEERN